MNPPLCRKRKLIFFRKSTNGFSRSRISSSLDSWMFPREESRRVSLVYDRWDHRDGTAMSLTMALRYCSNLIWKQQRPIVRVHTNGRINRRGRCACPRNNSFMPPNIPVSIFLSLSLFLSPSLLVPSRIYIYNRVRASSRIRTYKFSLNAILRDFVLSPRFHLDTRVANLTVPKCCQRKRWSRMVIVFVYFNT